MSVFLSSLCVCVCVYACVCVCVCVLFIISVLSVFLHGVFIIFLSHFEFHIMFFFIPPPRFFCINILCWYFSDTIARKRTCYSVSVRSESAFTWHGWITRRLWSDDYLWMFTTHCLSVCPPPPPPPSFSVWHNYFEQFLCDRFILKIVKTKLMVYYTTTNQYFCARIIYLC